LIGQQSADVEQVWFAWRHTANCVQRGMPRMSWRQHASGLLLQLPLGMSAGSQQLFAKLQLSVVVLQT
jgi:hypothetical protein